MPEAHYQLGLVLWRSADVAAKSGSSQANSTQDSLTQAETALRRVLQLDPDHAAAYLQLGLLLESRGDKQQAWSQFEKAAQLAPGLTEAHLELGRMAEDSQDWAAPLREFEAVLAWSPDNAEAHYGLAMALNAHGLVEEAAREMQIAMKLKPGIANPRIARPR